jgi:hypothetical protein
MGTVLAIGALVLLVGCHLAYCNWLTNGIKPRTFRTRIPAGDLRQIFREKVARAGWKIVDDGAGGCSVVSEAMNKVPFAFFSNHDAAFGQAESALRMAAKGAGIRESLPGIDTV